MATVRAVRLERALMCAALVSAAMLPALPAATAAGQTESSVGQVQAGASPGACSQGTLPHGARSLICVPASGWNGDLIVWAHGYVAPSEPLDFVQLTLPDGTSIPLLAELLGYAFATTSYRANGLVVLEGLDDVGELIAAFPVAAGRAPNRTYLAGVSEGGLVATLVAERTPQLVTGVLAACGPTADFGAQLQYMGDFRVLFDAYFPGVLPGNAVQVPPQLVDHWNDTYVPAIVQVMRAAPLQSLELVRVAGVPTDVSSPLGTSISDAIQLLWYSAFATNDVQAKLGGNPYDNVTRQYTGSANDADLNARVQRFTADPAARAELAAYRTSGNPGVPLAALHTTGDPVVPFWQALFYRAKANVAGSSRFTLLPIQRWGHCNFTLNDALVGLAVLLAQTGGAPAASTRSGETQIRLPSLRTSTEP